MTVLVLTNNTVQIAVENAGRSIMITMQRESTTKGSMRAFLSHVQVKELVLALEEALAANNVL